MFFNTLPEDADRPPLTFKEGVLTLSGNCIPENCNYTLGILFHEVFEYLKFHETFTIIFKFAHINTSSTAKFLDFIRELNKFYQNNKFKKIRIYWYYPHVDEDIEDLGNLYKDQSDLLAKKGAYKPIFFKLKSYEYE